MQNNLKMKLPMLVLGCCVSVMPACSKSNNLLFGRVEAQIADHTVAVTDCYRTSVPPPVTIADLRGGTTYRFAPCRDAVVTIKDEQLTVNGRSYGKLKPAAAVLVDHGVVKVDGRE